ncbi:uncharacterized protein LOC131150891 [Malania oleifera]|uniref:uncharacterized protein LOC131150891 n=1 Tax=Malania oleifera TaxID=397392 RepID=UPI0025AEC3EB|nr:uncharacterized protein LOC131150891 [Malania oleifera]
MGSLGNGDDDEIKQNRNASNVCSGETEAQDFDSQFSPPAFSGEKREEGDYADELQFMQNTVPFDDTLPLEDVFETQMVDLGGETQVLDNPDLDNISTQLIDGFDNDVVIDSDGEGTDRTEVLDDSDVLSEDDIQIMADSHEMDGEKLQFDSPCQKNEKEYTDAQDASIYKQQISESVRREFTSIRVSSLRASGLAARATALKGADGGSFPISSGGQWLKQPATENDGICVRKDLAEGGGDANGEHDQRNYNERVEGFRNESKARIGSSTVRKLFNEDTFSENVGSGNVNDTEHGVNLTLPLEGDNELAGLSYVDSQEPGDLSQANALDFVDRFIQVNVSELDQEVHHGKSSGGKSNPVSCAKGPQSLAKRASLISTVGETGIFDWDDSREDEGGGDLFCRRKEDFFDSRGKGRKCVTEPRKLRRVGRVDESGNKEEQTNIHNKIMGLLHSDSRIALHRSKVNAKTVPASEREIKKNLINELDEELNPSSSGGQLGTNADKLDVLNVGFDTQLAAEAMEALSHGAGLANHDANNKQGMQNISNRSPKSSKGGAKKRVCSQRVSLKRGVLPSDSGVLTRQAKRLKLTDSNLSKDFAISPEKASKKVKGQLDVERGKSKHKRGKLNSKKHCATNGSGIPDQMPSKIIQERKANRSLGSGYLDEADRDEVTSTSVGLVPIKKRHLQEEFVASTPIAHRTRHCRMDNHLRSAENVANDSREQKDEAMEVGSFNKQAKCNRHGDAVKVLNAKKKSSIACSDQFGQDENARKSLSSGQIRDVQNVQRGRLNRSAPKSTGMTNGVELDALTYPRGRRTRRSLSVHVSGTDDLAGLSRLPVGQQANGRCTARKRGLDNNVEREYFQTYTRKTRSSAYACPVLSSFGNSSEVGLLHKNSGKPHSEDAAKHTEGNGDAKPVSSAEGVEKDAGLEVSPRNRCELSDRACATPVSCVTPVNVASPVCMGNEYFKQSCKKNLARSSLMKEINSLTAISPVPTSASKNLRRRRDMSNVRVLFSHHLDDDKIKQQKKILARLGVPTASSISDATHFVTNQFVRTRNMLEAIALGKPVVTYLWLESCGQANCFIDDKNYILRDAKKEKEFGFSMPVSLTRACQHPLLEGRRVLITPNTKPGKEILTSLVKAVHGQAVERIGRSSLKNEKIPDDLLILSCEEDYALCVPFLEKGAAVYSSELLLNGIVTQKLEYERHRLFVEHVKRTRSTIWVKKDGNKFLPVTKHK